MTWRVACRMMWVRLHTLQENLAWRHCSCSPAHSATTGTDAHQSSSLHSTMCQCEFLQIFSHISIKHFPGCSGSTTLTALCNHDVGCNGAAARFVT